MNEFHLFIFDTVHHNMLIDHYFETNKSIYRYIISTLSLFDSACFFFFIFLLAALQSSGCDTLSVYKKLLVTHSMYALYRIWIHIIESFIWNIQWCMHQHFPRNFLSLDFLFPLLSLAKWNFCFYFFNQYISIISMH